MKQRWSDKELNFLRENFKSMTHQEMAAAIGRGVSSVSWKCSALGLKKHTPQNPGDVYGLLTIVEKLPQTYSKGSSRQQSIYLCKCKCGKETRVRGSNLQNGSTTSCGCLLNRKKRKAPGEAAYSHLYGSCRSRARIHNFEFSLSKEEFRSLTGGNCKYCGSGPIPKNPYLHSDGTRSKHAKSTSMEWASQSWIRVNGIDRIDSSLGYVLHNCVSCCSACNEMKNDRSTEEFLNHIARIAKFQSS